MVHQPEEKNIRETLDLILDDNKFASIWAGGLRKSHRPVGRQGGERDFIVSYL